jgi:hypothetical protein
MSINFDNDDTFDTRDLIAELKDLEDELQQQQKLFEERFPDEEFYPDGFPEYETLEILREAEAALNDSQEYKCGITLIAESHFEDYCRELVNDIGDIPDNFPSYIKIDWEQTAENLLADYTEIEINGNTFYYR